MLVRSLFAILVCAALLAVPASASAAPGAGGVNLAVSGGVLAGTGVKALPIAPATKRGIRIKLPIQKIVIGKTAKVVLRGGLRFKAGKRSLRLRAFRLKLSTGRVSISAKAGKRRITIFSTGLAKGKAKLDQSKTTARVAGARLALTRKAARLLRARLRVDDLTAGKLGKLGVAARPRVNGGTGGGLPTAGPITNTPTAFTRPPDAVDISSATLTWRPKVSWLCYVEESSPVGGAANGPVETLACPGSLGGPRDLVGSFVGFPFKSGWYHAPTGTAAIYFQGGVRFRYEAHGIDFSSTSPEIEINGGASRAIFTFDGTDGTPYNSERGVLVDLHPNPVQKPPSGTVNYVDIPATVPEDAGASIFAGLYGANEPFGTMTVSFTTP